MPTIGCNGGCAYALTISFNSLPSQGFMDVGLDARMAGIIWVFNDAPQRVLARAA